ncbi:type VI secretion system membrane subunit TssM [Erythrobacter sp. GH1-10]|uniref:type VI secretion system membrane subunit TssM n=1 Tax=Erythrobacter sp. GH1-10 TaxID=3349334 RepID=UPI003877E529
MKKFFTSWWTISIVTMVLLAALVCFGIPLFVEWMQPWWVRALFGGLFLLLWVLWWFLRRRKIKKAEAALAAELAGPDASEEEAVAVQGRMAEALKELRKASGSKRGYLYSLPWYVIIGPPGGGKTTALVNSGLRFPYSDQVLKGSGGTRNLDFLFAEEAVLVDTAGRYTTQDSDSEVDSAGWTRLLELLRKHRPFEPINGVFVAIPADDLQRGDVRVIDEHAAIIRRRLREIREALQTEVPVYLLVTKGDLLAGMTEYFDDLDVDGRRAVLGHTFPWKGPKLTSEDVTTAFDDFVNDVAEREPKRLEEEKDIRRRGLILGFPSQLHALRPALHRLIEGAFLNEDRPSGRLRGFYITSGTQDGSAIDRILQGVTQAYGNQSGAAGKGEGKAYFLNRLLQDVAFKEAGLPVSDAAVLRKRKTQLTAIVGAIAAFALLTVILWAVSFAGNREFQRETTAEALALAQDFDGSRLDLVRIGDNDASLEQVLPLLDALRNMPEGYQAQEDGGPSLWRRWGLFQSGLSQRNEEAYHIGLRRILLPRIMLRLEEKMRQEQGDALALYEPLKVYLMLGGHAPEGAIDPETIQRYIQKDWANEVYPGNELSNVRARLADHLTALSEDPNISAAWEGQQAPLDAQLVRASRQVVLTMSLAQRAYAIMREKASNPDEDWYMSAILTSGDAAAFANPEEVMNVSVPYFFTKDGFDKSYLIARQTARSDLESELWVLGDDANTASTQRELGNLAAGISGTYASEYIAHWTRVIESLEAGNYFDDPQVFRAFTKDPSPLRKVLLEVRDNTLFAEGGAVDEAGNLLEEQVNRNRIVRNVTRVAGAAEGRGLSADAEIRMAFDEINTWTGSREEAGRIEAFIASIRKVFEETQIGRGPGGDNNEGMARARGELDTEAATAPGPIQGFAQDVKTGGAATQVGMLQGQADLAYTGEVLPSCVQAVEGKFPFDAGSDEDAGISDVRSAFGSGGTIPTFVSAQLEPYLDRSDDFWRWKEGDPVAASFNPVMPGNLQKADALMEVINEGLPLTLVLSDLGNEASRVELTTGGIPLRFDLAENSSQSLQWQFGGGMVPSSEIKIFANTGIEGLDPMEEVMWRRPEQGPWSLFRLFERARIRNISENTVEAEFNRGPGKAVFEVSFPEELNPFSGGGLWSVKCPETL